MILLYQRNVIQQNLQEILYNIYISIHDRQFECYPLSADNKRA